MSSFLLQGEFIDDDDVPQHGRVIVTPSVLPLFDPDMRMIAWEPFLGKIDEGILLMSLPANDSTPTFSLLVEVRMNSGRQYFFSMVPGAPGATVLFDDAFATSVPPGGSLSVGPPGPSAYEVAVDNGFVGTEAEWLASLVGGLGPQGLQGPAGPQGIPGSNGADGQGLLLIDNGATVPPETVIGTVIFEKGP